MKRLIAIIIVISTLLSLMACGTSSKPNQGGNTDQSNDPNEILASQPKLNGVGISEYCIVYDAEGLDYNKRAAEYIRDTVLGRCGIELEIVDDSTAEGSNEIVVGETSRPISKELDEKTEGFEFAVLAKCGSVALEADYFVIAAAAYYLMDTYPMNPNYEGFIPEGVSILEPISKPADNFIMLIGDGMGVNQTLLFDYLADTSDYSDKESLFYGYMFPYRGYSRTSSYSGVTDSAAGGTALATGYKTYNEYVGLDKDGNRIKSLTELAIELGKASAVMSTETKTGATPSSFSSHTGNRDNTADILADQLLLMTKNGTVIDCGYDYYNARYMKVIENHITDTLGKVSADTDGFFLMYEEAHIDKKSHNNDMENTFLALIRFNQAIARFMEFAFYHPNTAVIITADHETGGLTLNENGNLVYTTEDHTAANVPVFAWGEGLESLNEKTVENIELAKLYASLMGEDSFGDPSNEWYDAIYGSAK